MRALIVLIGIFSLWIDLSYGMPSAETTLHRSPATLVMGSIPENDRPQFVAYHIALALTERSRNDVIFLPFLEIPHDKLEQFENIAVPANFSVNLLDWTELELVPIKNGHLRNPVANGKPNHLMSVCFPSGCVDPNDAGELCCPF